MASSARSALPPPATSGHSTTAAPAITASTKLRVTSSAATNTTAARTYTFWSAETGAAGAAPYNIDDHLRQQRPAAQRPVDAEQAQRQRGPEHHDGGDHGYAHLPCRVPGSPRSRYPASRIRSSRSLLMATGRSRTATWSGPGLKISLVLSISPS